MTVYVVTMYRWGEREKHSYLMGVFTSRDRAVNVGQDEEVYRGGKYSAEVKEVMVNHNLADDYWK